MAAKRRLAARTTVLKPSFGSGILAKSVRLGAEGHTTADGIFSAFWAWAFPCTRTCTAVITAFDLTESNFGTVTCEIRKRNSRNAERIATLDLKKADAPDGTMHSHTLFVPIAYNFTSAGIWELRFAFQNASRDLRIPFLVKEKPWPEFSKRELSFARRNPKAVSPIRVHVQCNACESTYVFEEPIFAERALAPGSRDFPEDDPFTCDQCGTAIHLRDVHGQVREATLRQIRTLMKKGT